MASPSEPEAEAEAELVPVLRLSQEEFWTRGIQTIDLTEQRIQKNLAQYSSQEYEHGPPTKTLKELSRARDEECARLTELCNVIDYVPVELLVYILQRLHFMELLRTKIWRVSKRFLDIFNGHFKETSQERFYELQRMIRDYDARREEEPSINLIYRKELTYRPRLSKMIFGAMEHEKRFWKPLCAMCGAPSRSRCSGCHQEPYCGRQCQAEHWKLCHKKQCKRK